MAWDSLLVGDKVYLAVANHGSKRRYETHSRIYSMDSTAKLTVIQDISTQGASDVKFFRPPGGTDIYLIVANQMNNAGQSRISSQVKSLQNLSWHPYSPFNIGFYQNATFCGILLCVNFGRGFGEVRATNGKIF